jgi:hypothetical protein
VVGGYCLIFGVVSETSLLSSRYAMQVARVTQVLVGQLGRSSASEATDTAESYLWGGAWIKHHSTTLILFVRLFSRLLSLSHIRWFFQVWTFVGLKIGIHTAIFQV